MPVLDIECQLARGQIARFLDGASFPGESLKQLEDHISECPKCQSMLSERRLQLEARTNTENVVRSVTEVVHQEAHPKAHPPKGTVWNQFKAQAGMKPVVLGSALVIVLIGMTVVSKNLNGILGPKVGATLDSAVGLFGARAAGKAPRVATAPVTQQPPATPTVPIPAITPKATPAAVTSTQGEGSIRKPTALTAPVTSPALVHNPILKKALPVAPVVKKVSSSKAPIKAQPVAPPQASVTTVQPRLAAAHRKRGKARRARHHKSWVSGIKVYDSAGSPVSQTP